MVKPRDFQSEYKNYQGTPAQIHNRSLRNQARNKLVSEGRVSKGDGKDVGHLKALGHGGSNSRSNLAVQSVAENRSFARTSGSKMKSETSKRERSR